MATTPDFDVLITEACRKYLDTGYPSYDTIENSARQAFTGLSTTERLLILDELVQAKYHLPKPTHLLWKLQEERDDWPLGGIISLLLWDIFIQGLLATPEVLAEAKRRNDDLIANLETTAS